MDSHLHIGKSTPELRLGRKKGFVPQNVIADNHDDNNIIIFIYCNWVVTRWQWKYPHSYGMNTPITADALGHGAHIFFVKLTSDAGQYP